LSRRRISFPGRLPSGGITGSDSFGGLWTLGNIRAGAFLRIYVEPPLARQFGWLPLFQGPITGIGLFTGGVHSRDQVTPIISAVARDVLSAVPNTQREAALALGATNGNHVGCS